MPPRSVVVASAISLLAAVVWTPFGVNGFQSKTDFKAGETIFVIIDSTELMVGQETLQVFDAGAPLKVVSVLGTWVEVQVESDGKPVVGWVRESNVSRVKPAANPAKSKRKADVPTTKSKPKTGSSSATSKTKSSAKSKVAETSRSDAKGKEVARKRPFAAQGTEEAAKSKKTAEVPTPSQKQPATQPTGKAPASGKVDPAETADNRPPAEKSPAKKSPGTELSKDVKQATTEVGGTVTSAEAETSEVGEGPEQLAEKFARILAEKRRAPPAPETAPVTEPAESAAPSPKTVAKSTGPEVNQAPTIGVLVLRIPDDLADIEKSERIEQLILSGDEFTNRSLRNLVGLTAMSLSIEAINVSNAGVQYVKDMRGIRMLRLWSPGIDDEALKLVAELSDLQVLDIEGTAIDGAKLAELQVLKKLDKVVLGPKISDASIAELVHLTALSQLDLRACGELTLACLEPLATLKELKIVWLPRHLRTKGKRALKSTLPECQVRS